MLLCVINNNDFILKSACFKICNYSFNSFFIFQIIFYGFENNFDPSKSVRNHALAFTADIFLKHIQ